MKKSLLLFICAFLFFTGCNLNIPAITNQGSIEPDYVVSLSNIQVNTENASDLHNGFMKIVFTYPTKNVAGETVTVSAVMCIPKNIYEATTKPKLDFMVLSNHGAMVDASSAPSVSTGNNPEYLASLIGNKIAIGIAPDYIGFGASVNQPQAFAYGDVNARTSLEAVICARMWLESQGYTWEDKLANVGFSQGGQTAMHVQKLVDSSTVYGTKVHVTKTFAGGGCYDMNTTIEESLKWNPPLTAEVIWLGIATFNILSNFGYDMNEFFKDGVPINKIIYDKDYHFGDSNYWNYMGVWSNSLTSTMLDPNSALRQDVQNRVSSFNCNFTPKSTSKIVMFAATNDDVVPTENSNKLYTYFTNHGYAMQLVQNIDNADFSSDKVYVKYTDTDKDFENHPYDSIHGFAGSKFYTRVIAELQSERW